MISATRTERDAWLTQQEAADYLSVTERALRKWVAQGRLSAHRIKGGRLLRYKRKELDALLAPVPTTSGSAIA